MPSELEEKRVLEVYLERRDEHFHYNLRLQCQGRQAVLPGLGSRVQLLPGA